MGNYPTINGYVIKSRTCLKGAKLEGANLGGANLGGANLGGANLWGADLEGANLLGADLRGAHLMGADLEGAHLVGADLGGANLMGADLRGAKLWGANLMGADLRGAKLEGAIGIIFQIPQEGELLVYKKTTEGVVKLRVPPNAKRTATPVGRKCRAEFVEVLEAPEEAWDVHSRTVLYKRGETIYPDKYDPDWRVECTHGIHFFLTREEAEAY
jgi:hypothetical protein